MNTDISATIQARKKVNQCPINTVILGFLIIISVMFTASTYWLLCKEIQLTRLETIHALQLIRQQTK